MPDSVLFATAPVSADASGLEWGHDDFGNPVVRDFAGNIVETPMVIGNAGLNIDVDVEQL